MPRFTSERRVRLPARSKVPLQRGNALFSESAGILELKHINKGAAGVKLGLGAFRISPCASFELRDCLLLGDQVLLSVGDALADALGILPVPLNQLAVVHGDGHEVVDGVICRRVQG